MAMQARWQHWWKRHEEGLLTDVEMVNSFLDSFDDNRTPQELASLPPGFLQLVKAFMQSNRPYKPAGATLGVTNPTPELQEQVRLERKRRYKLLAEAFGVEVTWSEDRNEFTKP
jgi:hypothetical protein